MNPTELSLKTVGEENSGESLRSAEGARLMPKLSGKRTEQA